MSNVSEWRRTRIVPKEHTTVDRDEDMDETSESDLSFTKDYTINCINLAKFLEDFE